MHATLPSRRGIALLSLAVLVLSLGINTLSAWIRHTEAGLACADRADCYGLIGALVDSGATAAGGSAALTPEPSAKRLHRALATLLVVLVLVLLQRARSPGLLRGSEARLPYAMAGLLLVLAVIGPASYLKTLPAIATVNLLGGVVLAACAWRLWLGTTDLQPAPSPRPGRRLLGTALALLLLQIALGAWQSANFAGLACAGDRGCALDIPLAEAARAFWYLRELPLDAAGRVQSEPAATLIHLAHRGGALAAGALLLAIAIAVLRAAPRLRSEAFALLALLAIQVALGVLALARELPLGAVLAHNGVATLLLLTLIRLRYRLTAEGGA